VAIRAAVRIRLCIGLYSPGTQLRCLAADGPLAPLELASDRGGLPAARSSARSSGYWRHPWLMGGRWARVSPYQSRHIPARIYAPLHKGGVAYKAASMGAWIRNTGVGSPIRIISWIGLKIRRKLPHRTLASSAYILFSGRYHGQPAPTRPGLSVT